MSTGFVYDPRFLEHDTGPGHPERPERLRAVLAAIRPAPWFEALVAVSAAPATADDLASVHSRAYIERAYAACAAGAPFLDTTDVMISPRSCEVAALAAGGALALGDALAAGRITNGFALLRPPGHHAEHDTALGFCLFNNIAVLARHLQARHGLERIAIVDWDVHHGNGTQHSFEADPSVFYASLHQYPYYPGTGAASETGIGAGAGTTLNCPMPAGAGDAEYERAFRDAVLPALDRFAPDCVLVSAGFDAHADDPLADIALTTPFFGWMTERLLETAARHAGGRLLSVLEGGYHLTRLGECVAVHLERLTAAA